MLDACPQRGPRLTWEDMDGALRPCKGESKGAGLKGEISRLLLHLAIEVRYYTFFFAIFSVTFNLG